MLASVLLMHAYAYVCMHGSYKMDVHCVASSRSGHMSIVRPYL